MTISNVLSSIFGDLGFQNATLFPEAQDSNPVGSFFYFFQLLEISALNCEYCTALALG